MTHRGRHARTHPRRHRRNCTRCKLHKGRTNIVFGVGNPKAELVFVGEGPGHDEDMQGRAVRRPRRKTSDADDRSHGPAPRRCLHLQRGEMPPAGKSPAGKRRNRHLLAVPAAPARRDPAESDLLPGQLRGADAAANHAGNFPIPRRMVRLPRRQIDRHLSSRLSAAQPCREERSLERPAESDGRPGPAAQETQRSAP